MRQCVLRSVLGLSAIAGSLAATVPANATMWGNAATGSPRLFLDLPNNLTKGQAAYLFHFSGLVTQEWNAIADQAAPGFFRLFAGQSRPDNLLLLGVKANDLSNGTSLIDWNPTGEANQSWQPVFGFTNLDNAACYSFHNRANFGKVMGVESGIALTDHSRVIITDDKHNLGQAWCAYTLDASGHVVAQNPPPF